MPWIEQAILARRLGVSRQRVNADVKAGKYTVKDKLVWIDPASPLARDGASEGATGLERMSGPDGPEARRQYQLLQNELLKIELRRKNRELISFDDAFLIWSDHIRTARERLLLIPDRFLDPIVREDVRREILEAMRDLSSADPPPLQEGKSDR